VAPAGAVPVVAGGPARLASQLTAAETVLAEGDAPPALMARQALIVQLACLRVAAHPGWASVVNRRVAPARRAAAAADIAATADLVALTRPRPRLPRGGSSRPRIRRRCGPTTGPRRPPKTVLTERGSNWVKGK
jgi:hypothetical protein